MILLKIGTSILIGSLMLFLFYIIFGDIRNLIEEKKESYYNIIEFILYKIDVDTSEILIPPFTIGVLLILLNLVIFIWRL